MWFKWPALNKTAKVPELQGEHSCQNKQTRYYSVQTCTADKLKIELYEISITVNKNDTQIHEGSILLASLELLNPGATLAVSAIDSLFQEQKYL